MAQDGTDYEDEYAALSDSIPIFCNEFPELLRDEFPISIRAKFNQLFAASLDKWRWPDGGL
eukprot:9497700-Pyramimonas_sp.AAC.2